MIRRLPAARPTEYLLVLAFCGLAAGCAYAAVTSSLYVVLGILGFLAVLGCFLNWRYALFGLLVLSYVDGFIKHADPSSVSYVVKDVMLGLVFCSMVVRLALHPEERPKGAWHGMLPWAGFMLFTAAELVHPAFDFMSGLAGFRAHVLFALLFIVGVVYFDSSRRLEGAANAVVGLSTFAALGGIVQFVLGTKWYALGPGFVKQSLHDRTDVAPGFRIPGQDHLVERVYGTLVDPIALGTACAVGLLFGAAALGRSRGIARLVLIAAMLVMMLGLLLTGTRSAMLAVGVGTLVLAVLSLGKKETRSAAITLLAVGLVVAPVGFAVSGGALSSRVFVSKQVSSAALARDYGATHIVDQLKRQPFGVGLGATGAGGYLTTSVRPIVADNLYLGYLYEFGPVGLGLLVLLQTWFFILTIRAAAKAPLGARTVFIGAAAAQAGLLTTGLFMQGSFDYAPLAQVFWLFCGAVAIPARSTRSETAWQSS